MTTMNCSKSFLNSSKSLSIYLRIFINYGQMIAIINSFSLKWPFYVSSYLNVSGNLGTISTQLFSLECLIYDFDLKINAIYLKALFTFVIYLSFLLSTLIVLLIEALILKQKQQKNTFIITIVVLSVLIQPNNLKEFFDIFNCVIINNKEYLSESISMECYSQEHKDWVILKN